jgi:hypothetical protein
MKEHIRDEIYHTLSDFSYQKKPMKTFEVYYQDGSQIWSIKNDSNFKLHDKTTGFDAVVYKSDDNVVVAFRGTQGDDLFGEGKADLATDITYIVNKRDVHQPIINRHGFKIHNDGKNTEIIYEEENQFKQADELVKLVKEKYPEANISLTGHSLGGSLATYAAALHNTEAVTYGAPSVVELLPSELQKEVMAGKFDEKITNYIHPKDSIGAGSINPYEKHIGASYYIGSTYEYENADNINNPLYRLYLSVTKATNYHSLDHYSFDKFGNINNPLLTLASTGNVLWKSPRYFTTEESTIDVMPEDLIGTSEELNSMISRIGELCSNTSRTIIVLDDINENSHLLIDTLDSIRNFSNWFNDETNELTRNLILAAETYTKADELK